MDATNDACQWTDVCACVIPHPSLPAAAAVLPVGPVGPESPGRSHYLGAHWCPYRMFFMRTRGERLEER